MIATGLDRLLADPGRLAKRRYGLLAHGASLTAGLVPAHLALAAAGRPPARLFGPEHGYYGVEQDMIPSHDERDPWTGVEIVSLYGAGAETLRPRTEAFDGLDLLVIDLQDVGSRYYTYVATAVWAAEVALGRGLEVWILDRPNPLGGESIEGNLREPGFESFVGAFRMPVRHGLTVAEIALLEARRGRWPGLPEVIPLAGWRRGDLWPATGRPWVAPSPNMPSFETALLYPGLCLIEATECSEGRGTTRPFRLIGAPGISPPGLARRLAPLERFGVRFVPTLFRPQFQKHAGEVCGGVELVVVERARLAAYRFGCELLLALAAESPSELAWRAEPYEFVTDRPAVDLLAGSAALRRAVERGRDAELDTWLESWRADEATFREERRAILLYPEGE